MNIRRFNPSTVPGRVSSVNPLIRISQSGTVFINAVACDIIGLKADDQVEVIQDADKPKDFYLVKSENGFKLRIYKSQGNGLLIQSSPLVAAILAKIPPPDGQKGFLIPLAKEPIQENGEKIYALLTSAVTKR